MARWRSPSRSRQPRPPDAARTVPTAAGRPPAAPGVAAAAGDEAAGSALGFPSFATKNTTRVAGADPIADAAGVAQAVWPATGATTRPPAVTVVQADDWRGVVAASVLVARPVRAPLLLADGDQLPQATKDALKRLSPAGSSVLGGAQVIKVGDVPASGSRTTAVQGQGPVRARRRDRPARHVRRGRAQQGA